GAEEELGQLNRRRGGALGGAGGAVQREHLDPGAEPRQRRSRPPAGPRELRRGLQPPRTRPECEVQAAGEAALETGAKDRAAGDPAGGGEATAAAEGPPRGEARSSARRVSRFRDPCFRTSGEAPRGLASAAPPRGALASAPLQT